MMIYRLRFNFKMTLYLERAIIVFVFAAATAGFTFANARAESSTAKEKTQSLLKEIVEKSFPEIALGDIQVKIFESNDTFFKAQFSFSRFVTFRSLKSTIYVNPLVFERNAPEDGIRAILAHELAHAAYYKARNRFQLLGLVSLVNAGYTAKFERRADLAAIEKGYGDGLIKYREWLYTNLSAKQIAVKKRNYFSPSEIRVLLSFLSENPTLMEKWKREIPKNLAEIVRSGNG